MKVDATKHPKRKRSNYKTLPKDHSQRKKKGYLWLVDRRVGDDRKRKFFRKGEAQERDNYIAEIDEQIINLAREDHEILGDHKLLEQASRAAKKLAPFGKTISDAVTHYIEFLEAEAKRNKTLVREVIESFLKTKEGKSARHYKDLKSRLGKFEKEFGEQEFSSVKDEHLDDWLKGLNLAAQTQKNHRRIVSSLFQYGIKKKVIAANPMMFVETDEIDEQEIITLSSNEITLLLSKAPPELLPSLVLMAFCGIRNSEIVKKTETGSDDLFIDWKHISFKSNTVTITGQQAKKTKKKASRRVVKISDNAVKWLKPIKKGSGRVAEFRTDDLFNHALTKLRKDCGFDDWPNNGLRNTFISCHYATYDDVTATANQAGNSPETIKTHYLNLIQKEDAAFLWEMTPRNIKKIPLT